MDSNEFRANVVMLALNLFIHLVLIPVPIARRDEMPIRTEPHPRDLRIRSNNREIFRRLLSVRPSSF